MTTQNPLVSIVIPTYNQAHFLREALESVVLQTYPFWEAFVVNNQSDDNTIEVVERFNDPRIRLVNIDNHGVIAASRNEGIRLARGEYVAFLDSDDIWEPAKIERCVQRLETGCDLVCHGTVWRWENGRTRNVIHGPEWKATYESLLYRGNCIATSATVVRKNILDELGGFNTDPGYVTAEDYELWLRITKARHRVCFIPGMLGIYRIHRGSASKAVKSRDAELAVVNHHFAQEHQQHIWRKIKRRKRRSGAAVSNARQLGALGDRRAAAVQIVRALKLWPLNWKAYAVGLLTVVGMKP